MDHINNMESYLSSKNILKSFSITGNTVVDTMIMMNIWTFFKTYIEMAATMIKNWSLWVFYSVYSKVYTWLKSRLTGQVVLKVKMDPDDELYSTFLEKIIESTIESDVPDNWKFRWLKFEDRIYGYSGREYGPYSSNDYDFHSPYYGKYHAYQSHFTETITPVKLGINYTEEDSAIGMRSHSLEQDRVSKIFKLSTSELNDTQMKVWKKDHPYFLTNRTFYIKFTWVKSFREIPVRGDDSPNQGHQKIEFEYLMTDVILFDQPKQKISNAEFFHIFRQFLKLRFNINDDIIRSYHVQYKGENIYNDVWKSLRFTDQAKGMLAYGKHDAQLISEFISYSKFSKSSIHNDTLRTPNEKKLGPHCEVELGVSPREIGRSYSQEIYVNETSKLNIGRNQDSTWRILLNIFDPGQKILGNGFNLFGYFTWNNMIILMYGGGIWIAKRGLLTDRDVKEIIDHIIAENLKSRKSSKDDTQQVEKKQVYVYKYENREWVRHVLAKRSLETIYLDESLKESVVKEFNNFVQMQDLYQEYEIPYRKGVLFYGPPGTGKTSLVKALAYEYQIPLYLFNVNDEDINDDTINKMLNSLGGKGLKILLFEDIDTAFADKEKMANEHKLEMSYLINENEKGETTVKNSSKSKYLTYSGLLNALDGVLSNHTGVITIMTTNYIERLGQAFLRPGRIDCKFQLDACQGTQIKQMVRFFVKNRIRLAKQNFKKDLDPNREYCDQKLEDKCDAFAARLCDTNGRTDIRPCEMQSYLLRNIDEIENVFKNVDTLNVIDHTVTEEEIQKLGSAL